MRFHSLIHVPRTIEQLVSLPAVRMEGWISWRLIHARTGLVKRFSPPTRNLVVNGGLDAMQSTGLGALLNYMAVGTSSTAPSTSHSALVAEISPSSTNRTADNGGVSDVFGYTSGAEDFQYRRLVRLFGQTQGNGNLTEVGWFSGSTGGTMFMRQLLKDVGGTPTVISKTSEDQLEITYEHRVYPPVSDVVLSAFDLTTEGTTHDVTVRALAVNQQPWRRWLAAGPVDTGDPAGRAYEENTLVARTANLDSLTAGTNSSVSNASYTNGNYYRDQTIIWDPSVANFTLGIGLIACYLADNGSNPRHMYQMLWNPRIPKTDVKRLTLVIRRSWGRKP